MDRLYVYNVRRPNGKLCACSVSLAHAKREIKWQLDSGFPGPFEIERAVAGERQFPTQWGSVHGGTRAGFKWPGAKNFEFIKRYMRGEPIYDLERHFGTNSVVLCRKAREFGFNKRIDDPRNFEKHGGRWTGREERLVNFMYDDTTPLVTIAGSHPRTEKAIASRLRDTAPELSERSKFGRFIKRPGSGNRAISPVDEPR